MKDKEIKKYYRIKLLKNNAILALFLKKKKKDDEFTRMKENDTAYLLEHNEFSTQTEVTTVCYNGVPFEKNIYSMNHYNSVMLNVSYQKVKRC